MTHICRSCSCVFAIDVFPGLLSLLFPFKEERKKKDHTVSEFLLNSPFYLFLTFFYSCSFHLFVLRASCSFLVYLTNYQTPKHYYA